MHHSPAAGASVVTPREAATVLLVRDAPELEVFMLRRSAAVNWVSGAHVFPGGAVEPSDSDARIAARCVGIDDATASARIGVASRGLAHWIAAVRETFEEAGVLLAREARTGDPVDGSAAALASARDRLNAGTLSLADALDELDLVLDVGAMHVFAHWITPERSPRRYDTWFFVAQAPDGHAYRHDDLEADASEWVRPTDVLGAAARGDVDLIFPTQRTLEELTAFATASDLLGWLERAPAGVAGFVREPSGGERIALPRDSVGDEGAA